MRANVKWTNLTHQEIADRLAEDHGIAVSVTVVKRLLRQHDFVRRKAQKRQRTGEVRTAMRSLPRSPGSRRSTLHVALLSSTSTPKKELIGNLYRPGTLYTQATVETPDFSVS